MLAGIPSRTLRLMALACLLAAAASSQGQQTSSAEPACPANSAGCSSGIYYTGDLFGYFRWPDLQDNTMKACPSGVTAKADVPSDAAAEFFQLMAHRPAESILVGMGNNFAPELYARVMPDRLCKSAFGWPTKDEFLWDYEQGKWLFDLTDDARKGENCKPAKEALDHLLSELETGQGRIPMDNVGCFLSRAGYTAVVPGKHDFYFGPQYLRHAARFLATLDGSNNLSPVQMLGANLVIQTAVENAAPRIPYRDRPHPWYSDNAAGMSFELSDGDMVFPWKQTLQVKKVPADAEVRLCEGTKAGNPDRMEDREHCTRLETQACDKYAIPPAADGASRLKADTDYALCVFSSPSKAGSHERPYCVRFGVYAPFFLYPNPLPAPGRGWTKNAAKDRDGGYYDPRPYLVMHRPGGDVAIFGVVDPELTSHIGMLNYAWENTQKAYTTEVRVVDPVVALGQLLEYFDAEHPDFKGEMILLAQMPAHMARRIATAMRGRFNLIIAQADKDEATVEEDTTVTLSAGSAPSSDACHPPERNAHTFVVVPAPYYQPTEKQPAGGKELRLRVASAELSTKEVSPEADAQSKRRSINYSLHNKINARFDQKISLPPLNLFRDVPDFTRQVAEIIPPADRLSAEAFAGDKDGGLKLFQFLTLELMQREKRADVAMLQKRDFFSPLLNAAPNEETLQETLDRIFWKGDFLLKLMVRGETLKSVLNESKRFDSEDSAPLSLPHEKQRGLVYVGVLYDQATQKYFINGEPLDENRIYSVATSDYVALGDTGYSELRRPPVGQAWRPGNREVFRPIGDLVCEHFLERPEFQHAHCEHTIIDATEYFDRLNHAPFDSTAGLTPMHHFLIWARFRSPGPPVYETRKPDALLQRSCRSVRCGPFR